MLRHVLTGILILLLTVIQSTILRGIEIFHVIPNLLLIALVSYSLCRSEYSALVVGICCGLLLDFIGGRSIGMNTLLCAVATYVCLVISDSLFNNNTFVAMVFVLVFSIFYELLIYIFYFAIWGEGHFAYALFCKIIPISVYNFLFTPLIYPIMRRITGERPQ